MLPEPICSFSSCKRQWKITFSSTTIILWLSVSFSVVSQGVPFIHAWWVSAALRNHHSRIIFIWGAIVHNLYVVNDYSTKWDIYKYSLMVPWIWRAVMVTWPSHAVKWLGNMRIWSQSSGRYIAICTWRWSRWASHVTGAKILASSFPICGPHLARIVLHHYFCYCCCYCSFPW